MESRSRFLSINSLILLRSKLDELNNKCENLQASTQSIFKFMNNNELIQLKYNLLITLREDINNLIMQFNNTPKEEDELNEKTQIIKLIAALHDRVNDFIKLNQDTLNKPTSPAKFIGENAIYYTGKIATLGSMYATGGLSILPVAIGWYGSSKITSSLNSQLGFSEEYTSTMSLLNDLHSELERVFNFFHADLSHHGRQLQIEIKRKTNEDLISLTTKMLNATMNWAHSDASSNNNANNEVNNYSSATKSYIDNIKKENFLQEIAILKLTKAEEALIAKFKDPITQEYLNIPVRLNDNIYELDTLLKITVNGDGKRRDPFKNFVFSLCHIQSALDVANEMKEIINTIKQQRKVETNAKQEIQEPLPSNVVLTLRNNNSPLHQPINKTVQPTATTDHLQLNMRNS